MWLFHLLMPRCGAKKGTFLLGLLWPNGKTIRAVVLPTTSFVLQLWPSAEAQGKGTRPRADRLLALSTHCSVPAILSRAHLQAWLGLFMVQPPMTLPQVRFSGLFIIKDPGSRCSCQRHAGLCFTAAQAGEAEAQPHHSPQVLWLCRLSSELHASSGREGTAPQSTPHVSVHCCKLWAPVWAQCTEIGSAVLELGIPHIQKHLGGLHSQCRGESP